MHFRYDINGLRAIAVIAVVLFHFNPVWIPGGFAGVDVFFSISGFLMTGIIFRELENDNFNLFKFYLARANRIIPALAVLCLVLLLFGWFYLAPLDYRALGKHVASSVGFLSNVTYWRESGYFDATSHDKWLLHTWSLSVEWQFYILYPIVLVLFKKFLSLENLKRLIVVGAVLGFAFSAVATIKWPNPAYYLLPTRAWEMMIGGIAFLYPWSLSENKKKIIELIGLVLILGSYAFVSSDVPWPGHFAFLPVLGSYLMIASNQQSSLITNNAIFQYLGKWSYSIYLWHWPVVVFGYYFNIQGWTLYGLPLSVSLGFMSFKFIEGIKFESFYQWNELLKVKLIYLVLSLALVGNSVFTTMYEHTSIPDDVVERSKRWERADVKRKLDIQSGICQFNQRGQYKNLSDYLDNWSCHSNDESLVDSKFLVFGDSHSADKAMGFRLNGIDVTQVGGAGCPLSPYLAEKRNNYCLSLYSLLDNASFDNVILASAFKISDLKDPLYLKSVLSYWSSKGKVIIIFSPMPDLTYSFNQYLRFGSLSYKVSLDSHRLFFSSLEKLSLPSNVKVINTYELWCGKEGGECNIANKNGDFLMLDGGHLSSIGSKLFIKKLLSEKGPLSDYLP